MTLAKILVVDDDIEFNETISDFLLSREHQVMNAFDGQQGIAFYQLEHPDLVITDIVMPKVDGMEFLMKLRDLEDGMPQKVIAMSGGGQLTSEYYLDMAKAFGVDRILAKPFSTKALEQEVNSVLEQF
jgi:CheY-like chemotaxis protein